MFAGRCFIDFGHCSVYLHITITVPRMASIARSYARRVPPASSHSLLSRPCSLRHPAHVSRLPVNSHPKQQRRTQATVAETGEAKTATNRKRHSVCLRALTNHYFFLVLLYYTYGIPTRTVSFRSPSYPQTILENCRYWTPFRRPFERICRQIGQACSQNSCREPTVVAQGEKPGGYARCS